MKRHGNLWPDMISFRSLLSAASTAQRGKRFRPSVAAFNFHLEAELWRLHRELADQTYQPGSYRTFNVFEPKKRLISAAPFRDRVVHHALTRVLEPIFERSFIADSYACRVSKGTHEGKSEGRRVKDENWRSCLKEEIMSRETDATNV